MKINFLKVGNTILENERLILKPLSLLDFDHLLPFSENEPEIWKFTLVKANGRQALTNYINNGLEGKSVNNRLPFIVIDKLTNSYTGSTRFYDIDVQNQNAQIGSTWYGKEFQGTGRNSRNIAAMKKIGCTEEGILRSNYITSDGLRRHSIVFSILKSEWEGAYQTTFKFIIKNTLRKCLN